MPRAVLIVLDGVGCGAAPDAASYGDANANTLAHTATAVGGLHLPNLAAWGLGRITAIDGVPPAPSPRAAVGRMREASAGKDTTTGHWEMCGLVTREPFATFPRGFPAELVDAFTRAVGRGVLGNKAASGTAIIDELGAEHLRSGKLILYTSGDSVFQIAAHGDVVPVSDLHAICEKARRLCDPWRIARVIARPFVGEPGAFRRTYDRRDFAMPPPGETLCDRLAAAGVPVVGIGKIPDIFSGRGIAEAIHTEGNADGLRATLAAMERLSSGLIFTNLVDFDMLYGHRRDPAGFARALCELDAALPELERRMRPGDWVALSADHGTDPTAPGSDHTREHVPVIVRGGRATDLGTRATFADLGQTLAEHFGAGRLDAGESFLGEIQPLPELTA
ncbi:MAG: phosphopentomutase [Myxococcota bacterium]